MRNPPHDPGLTPDITGAERRCILSGEHGERAALIRLALSPDGDVVPDIAARAPGRGAWIGVGRAVLEAALAKGKLKAALARSLRDAKISIPADLPALIDAAFTRLLLAQLGMAAKAGVLLAGADRVDSAARSGQVHLLLHAADAAEDGRRKRDQSWRVGEDAEGTGQAGRILPLGRDALGAALGRDNVVHLAIIDAGWASRFNNLLERWHRYTETPMGAAAAAA